MSSCSNCGTPLVSGAKYCHNCGNISASFASGMPVMPGNKTANGIYGNNMETVNIAGQRPFRFFKSVSEQRRNKSRKTWILLIIATSAILAIAIIIYALILYKNN